MVHTHQKPGRNGYDINDRLRRGRYELIAIASACFRAGGRELVSAAGTFPGGERTRISAGWTVVCFDQSRLLQGWKQVQERRMPIRSVTLALLLQEAIDPGR